MIIKILSRHSPTYAGLITYILKGGKGEANEQPTPYLHNFRGKNVTEWIRELYINEAFRKRQRKGQVYFYHAILSFNGLDSDKITNDMITDITNKFIELRGKDAMYIAAQHRDREHAHIHFLISGLSYRTGKAFRMTKGEMQELKIKLQEYQKEKYPELENSLPQHGAGKEYLSPNEYNAKTKGSKYLKFEFSQQVKDTLSQATSQKHFLKLLQERDLHHYERGGRPYGITVDDKNYRFSSLGIYMEQLTTLEQDLSEEERALEEIRQLRNDVLDINSLEIESNDITLDIR